MSLDVYLLRIFKVGASYRGFSAASRPRGKNRKFCSRPVQLDIVPD